MYNDRNNRNNNNFRRTGNNRMAGNTNDVRRQPRDNVQHNSAPTVSNNRSGVGGNFRGGNGGGGGAVVRRSPANDIPLRMVVNAKYVGAIIGQGGSNIRQITKDSKARCVVDVSRGMRDPTGTLEKVINIYGPLENCSKACSRIFEVIHHEAQNDAANQGKNVEPELKLRAHNNLVGRLIGKGGSTIKKIMEETGCTIFVSNHGSPLARCYARSASSAISIGELNAFNMERTITIRGTAENIQLSEQKISAKLRQCWENDLINSPQSMYPPGGVQPMMNIPPPFAVQPEHHQQQFHHGGGRQVQQRSTSSGAASLHRPHGPGPYLPSVPPPSLPPPPSAHHHHQGIRNMGGQHQQSPGGAAPPTMPTHQPMIPVHGSPLMLGGQQQQPQPPTEVVYVWVPNNIVGALIGTKGVNIRNAARLTGAQIRIEAGRTIATAAQPQEEASTPQQEASNATDSSAPPAVPPETAERRVTIIGSDFQQYKAQFWIFQRVCEQGYHFFDEARLCTEVQVPSRTVGRIIGKGGQNVRELQRITGAHVKIPDDAGSSDAEQTIVQIVGNFNASWAVQCRIRHLINQFRAQNYRMGDAPPTHHYRNVNPTTAAPVVVDAASAAVVVNHNDADSPTTNDDE